MMEHTKEPWNYGEDNDGWYLERKLGNDGQHGYALSEENARRIVACVNACAGIPNEQLECDNVEFVRIFNERNTLKQQLDELLVVFQVVIAEMEHRGRNDGNAPGHGHDIPGVWDSDNGKLAGKPCGWCAVWKKAKELCSNGVKGGES